MSNETKEQPTNAIDSNALLALACFLAKLHTDLNALRWGMVKMTPEECENALIMKWPEIQGTRNQNDLKKVGEIDFDVKDVRIAVDQILANVLDEAECKPTLPDSTGVVTIASIDWFAFLYFEITGLDIF